MGSIADNLTSVRARIATAAKDCGRDPLSIKLVAVSKTKAIEGIREAFAAGQRVFGENYAQELRRKADALADLPIEWHCIGHLQKNKAKLVASGIAWIETIDSLDIAQALEQRVTETINTLIEVNVGGEITKSGVLPEKVPHLLSQLQSLKKVTVRGLMCIPPYDPNPEKSRPFYQKMRKLLLSTNLNELSMGMSHDFEVAISEGATIIRVGEALFGPR
ncbi:MAG: YggS family pyridoxal phosphate-dependent enzyme [Deltaproteobacteria bacterium]|nr:YggS family pyridoxal phosphate-dependent enzyme [Deltaproteobacteria bacterium]